MTVPFIIALGSNFNAETNLYKAKTLLSFLADDGLDFTENIVNDPIGIAGPTFTNCMAWGNTELCLEAFLKELKVIEKQCGNTREKRQRGIIEMDIDLMLYDGKRYHEADWDRPYIQELLKMMEDSSILGVKE